MKRTINRLARATVCGAATLTIALLSAAPAYAAGGVLADAATERLNSILNHATAWLIGILAAVATLFLTLGGVRYVMAGGDPGEVEKAKGAFKSAGLGYALAGLAPVVVGILKGILGI
jgi:succinate dehydrogenase/fumarate reductase cytochrome b subunit